MSVPIWTWKTTYPIRRRRAVERIRLELGAGFTKAVIKSVATSHADGQGAVTSYRGANIFEITVQKKNYGGDTQFKSILAFLQARVDALDEAFYWYDSEEEPNSANWDGTHTTGRYKVKNLTEIEDVLTHANKHDFANLIFEETFL